MVIIYGTRTVFKREGPVGTSVCPNCRHNVMHTLCRQLNQATLFYIPIFSHQKQRSASGSSRTSIKAATVVSIAATRSGNAPRS